VAEKSESCRKPDHARLVAHPLQRLIGRRNVLESSAGSRPARPQGPQPRVGNAAPLAVDTTYTRSERAVTVQYRDDARIRSRKDAAGTIQPGVVAPAGATTQKTVVSAAS
jgi:hypothetical protein